MGVTWALFAWKDGRWEFVGTTPHDEKATEFEETEEYPVQVVGLEDPPSQDQSAEDVEVEDETL